jgi:hypothetical protein
MRLALALLLTTADLGERLEAFFRRCWAGGVRRRPAREPKGQRAGPGMRRIP